MDKPSTNATTVTVELVEMSHIKIPEMWGKREQKEENIEEMAASLRANGMVEPLVARKVPGSAELRQLIDGRHRYAGAVRAGWTHVPVIIVEYTDSQAERASLSANLHRYDYEGPEYDAAIARLKELWESEHGPARRGRPSKDAENDPGRVNFVTELAKATSRSPSAVRQASIRHKKQTPEVKAARQAKKVTNSQTDELVRLPPEKQVSLLAIVEGKSLEETRKLVNQALDGGGPEDPATDFVVANPGSEPVEPQKRLDVLIAQAHTQAYAMGPVLTEIVALLETCDLAEVGGDWTWLTAHMVEAGRVDAHVREHQERSRKAREAAEIAPAQSQAGDQS